MLRLVEKIYETVGTAEKTNDGHRERRWRGEILRWACEVGHKECHDRAYQYLKNWIHMPLGENPYVQSD